MLKKIALASALALGFLTSFQFGNAATANADVNTFTAVRAAPVARAASCDPVCSAWNPVCDPC